MIGTRTSLEVGKIGAIAPISSTAEVAFKFTSLFFFEDPPKMSWPFVPGTRRPLVSPPLDSALNQNDACPISDTIVIAICLCVRKKKGVLNNAYPSA
jgi:hypothetical protein